MQLCLIHRFQLHHTGIKTWVLLRFPLLCPNFNCTIQELKLDNVIEIIFIC